MNKINYQKILDGIIEENSNKSEVPKLLLHACCAPCSSYCLEYLSNFFEITVFYFNPNISLKEEYEYRLCEEKRLISLMEFKNSVNIVDGVYNPNDFYTAVRGLEKEPEGGKRCEKCFRLRLEASAAEAKKLGCDYFATTLTISPLKNAQLINTIGEELGQQYGVKWLFNDFKKKEGYKRSIILSKKYNLYRQNYCGCIFSKRLSENQTN